LRVGIRITLLRVAYGTSAPGQPLDPMQRRFGAQSAEEVLDAVARLQAHPDPRVQVGLAPHSIRAVPVDWMAQLATFPGVIHAHVSEQPGEVRASLDRYGVSPLQLLADHGLVSERFTAIHMTFPEPGDADLLRESGARICVCPSTELDLGDGFLPLELRDGIDLCVGSDSHARIDLLDEVRALELHGRALANRRHVLTPVGEPHGLAEVLLGAATRSGRRSLGHPGAGLQIGAPADLITMDLNRTAAYGVPPLEAAAFIATPDWIDDVWVAGERIVTNGRHEAREAILNAAKPWLPTP
jgi:formimidoylglutamate deiminase